MSKNSTWPWLLL